jgi:Uncharacterized small protein
MAKFKVGDVVVLKSGSPKLTVVRIPDRDGGYYSLKWFAGAKHNDTTAPEEALEFPQPASNSKSASKEKEE